MNKQDVMPRVVVVLILTLFFIFYPQLQEASFKLTYKATVEKLVREMVKQETLK